MPGRSVLAVVGGSRGDAVGTGFVRWLTGLSVRLAQIKLINIVVAVMDHARACVLCHFDVLQALNQVCAVSENSSALFLAGGVNRRLSVAVKHEEPGAENIPHVMAVQVATVYAQPEIVAEIELIDEGVRRIVRINFAQPLLGRIDTLIRKRLAKVHES